MPEHVPKQGNLFMDGGGTFSHVVCRHLSTWKYCTVVDCSSQFTFFPPIMNKYSYQWKHNYESITMHSNAVYNLGIFFICVICGEYIMYVFISLVLKESLIISRIEMFFSWGSSFKYWPRLHRFLICKINHDC